VGLAFVPVGPRKRHPSSRDVGCKSQTLKAESSCFLKNWKMVFFWAVSYEQIGNTKPDLVLYQTFEFGDCRYVNKTERVVIFGLLRI
jgi:hypothetical protein